jgi:hypothetical protein
MYGNQNRLPFQIKVGSDQFSLSRCLVLMDVEGLFDAKKQSRDHDLNLFAVALLNSRVFIYNMIAVIRNNSLEGLHFASKIASQFTTSFDEKKHLSSQFPQLVWALRDVDEIEVEGKTNPTANDYMEDILSKDTEECRQIKECFQKRECFAFEFPIDSVIKKKSLAMATEDQLVPQFVQETNRLLKFIAEHSKTKVMNGYALTGLLFSSHLKHLLHSILRKNIEIKNISQYVEEDINRKVFKTSIAQYKEAIQALRKTFPGNILQV